MTRLLQSVPRMAFMSLISFGLNLGLFTFFVKLAAITPELSAAVAAIIVMGLNFVACRYWIFDARGGNAHKQLALFMVATLAFRGAEIGLFSFIYRLTYSDELLVYSIVLVTSFLIKFLFFEKAVFARI